MLEHKDIARFEEVKAAAEAMGKDALAALQSRLDYLGNYANGPGCTYERLGTKCVLGYDSAPLSFGFDMFYGDGEHGWRHWFSGGLLYHGPGGNPMAIELFNSHQPHWGIHT